MPAKKPNPDTDNIIVFAASLSIQLRTIIDVAREMALSVKNARAIAVRAGDAAKGFHPITDFINELATQVTALIEDIQKKARDLSRVSVTHKRLTDTRRRFNSVEKKLNSLAYGSSLSVPLNLLDTRQQVMLDEFKHYLSSLSSILEEVNQQMRAARVIATASNVEASRAGSYRKSLEVVALNLNEATILIQDNILAAKSRVNALESTLATSTS